MSNQTALETILDDCLARLAQGESIETCLAEYPQWAEELRPLLELGSLLHMMAVPAAQEAARQQGEERLKRRLRSRSRSGWLPALVSIPSQILSLWKDTITNFLEVFMMKKAFASLALVVALLFGSGALTAFASQNALPGDALYPVKTALEDARLALTSNHAAAARLALQLSERRVQELTALAQAGRFDDMQAAAQRLNAHLQTAAQSLEALARTNPTQANAVAVLLTQAQQSEQQVIASLQDAAPVAARPALNQAVAALQESGRAASAIQAQTAGADTQVAGMPAGSSMDSAAGTVEPGESITSTVGMTATETMEPGGTVTVTETMEAGENHEFESTITPTMTMTPTATMTATAAMTVTGTMEPTETPEPGEHGNATPMPSSTPQPTTVPSATPQPTVSPTPQPTTAPSATPTDDDNGGDDGEHNDGGDGEHGSLPAAPIVQVPALVWRS